jgi:hypothetical protein
MNGFWAVWIALGGNAAFLLVVAFLGKKIVAQWLDKDVERFKAALDKDAERFRSNLDKDAQQFQASLDRETERFKSDVQAMASAELERLRGALQIAANEHSILLSKLQEKRAEVIDELYKRLALAISAVTSYVAIFELPGELPKEEKAKSAAAALLSFREYLDQKRIWLPVACCAKVDILETGLRGTFHEFLLNSSGQKHSLQTEPGAWRRAWEDVTKNLGKLVHLISPY